MPRLDDWIAEARHFRFDGQRIAFWTAGSGRPLLLVHGFPTSSWDWHPVWNGLARDRRLIACDMLGFGLSDKPRGGYSIARQADLQDALLAHCDVGSCDAIVHDYGVSVMQELLARRLQRESLPRIDRVLFLNGGLFPESHRPLAIQRFGAGPLGFLLSRVLNRRLFGRAFARVFANDAQPTPAELDEFWSLIARNNGHRRAHQLLRYLHERRIWRERWVGALQQCKARLHLLVGADDPVSGRQLYERFRELVPHAGATCLDGVGHYPQIEAPGRVLAAATQLLAEPLATVAANP